MEDWRDKLASRKERQNRTAGFIAMRSAEAMGQRLAVPQGERWRAR